MLAISSNNAVRSGSCKVTFSRNIYHYRDYILGEHQLKASSFINNADFFYLRFSCAHNTLFIVTSILVRDI